MRKRSQSRPAARRTEARRTGTELAVAGRRVPVSNLDKVLYPETGFTKGDVIKYYIEVAPVLLPHLRDRPITLKRYPNGVEESFFYEKRCPSHRPNWVDTADVWSDSKNEEITFCVINDLPVLVWAANLADLELHTFLAKSKQVSRPTMVVFDLDPGSPANIIQCCQVALSMRELFVEHKLQAFPKTSGSKGLQLYIPLNSPADYDQTKHFARSVAQVLERTLPDLVVSKMARNLRAGKVFIDWSQNDQHKTTVSAYSLRAKSSPSVSTPLDWDEVAEGAKLDDPEALRFSPAQALKRISARGDLFAPVLALKQRLPKKSIAE